MARRTFEIEFTTTVTLVIDDEVHPNPDYADPEYLGDNVLTRHANPLWQKMYYGDIGRDRSLLDLAIQVGFQRRSISQVDGWADFPDDACKYVGWPDYDLVSVTERTDG